MRRRDILLATPAALLAQAPPAPAPQAPSTSPAAPQTPLPQTPEEELKAASEQLRRNSDQLKAAHLPMFTEPAVHFKP